MQDADVILKNWNFKYCHEKIGITRLKNIKQEKTWLYMYSFQNKGQLFFGQLRMHIILQGETVNWRIIQVVIPKFGIKIIQCSIITLLDNRSWTGKQSKSLAHKDNPLVQTKAKKYT